MRRRVYLLLGGSVVLLLVLLTVLEGWRGASTVPEGPAVGQGGDSIRASSVTEAEPPGSGPADAGPDDRRRLGEKGDRRPTARAAIIIDDLGYEEGPLELAGRLGFPVTYSVLPLLPHSASSAARLHAAGFEIMLHLPMEPEDYPDERPGEGALFTFMSAAELRQVLEEDLLSVPHISGVNNHMGSRFCQRRDLLRLVLGELKTRRLFFVDSRTSPGSVAHDLAESLGLLTARRSVFLDNPDDDRGIGYRLEELFQRAEADGRAVGIGHYRRLTLESLERLVPERLADHPRVELVFASAVVS